jgi:peptide/nickel transport system ATP-binding protein/oligopeptide transport system ATP-binding protein
MSEPAHAARPLVVLRDVRKTFHARGGGVRAVDGVDLEIEAGKTMALVGESGSGKTTLGRCVLRLLGFDGGSIEVAGASLANLRGRALREFRRNAQMVFQDPYGSLNPRMRVGTILEEPLILHEHDSRSGRRQKVAAVLARVHLDASYARRFPGELSGGEQQRVGIARAVITEPRLIVLDEPTAALDAPVRKGIFELLTELQRTMGLTYLLISHDLASVWGVSDAVAVMHRGRIVEAGSRDDVFLSPGHPYTVALMSAAPYVAQAKPERARRLVLQGDEDLEAEDVCRFAGRCPLAVERCRSERPQFERIGERHAVACWRWSEVPVELGGYRERWHALHLDPVGAGIDRDVTRETTNERSENRDDLSTTP